MPIKLCEICSKEFYAKPFFIKRGHAKYCSKKCQSKAQKRGKFINCDTCGKQAWKMPKHLKHSKSGKFFCTKSCQTLWRNRFYSGPRHPNWKDGGRTHYRNVIKKHSEIPRICANCKNNDERVLVVHHKNRNRKNNNIENLMWLCSNCHLLVHHYNEKI